MKEEHMIEIESHEEWLAYNEFVEYHSKRLKCQRRDVFIQLSKESKKLGMTIEILQPLPPKKNKKDDEGSPPKILKHGPRRDD